MSWFNFNTKKPRKIDIEFERELNKYYERIRTVTTREQASKIPPDFDEVKEDEKELRRHPENEDFARLGRIRIIPSSLNIDPANPPQRLTKPKPARVSKNKGKEYTHGEMETIYRLHNPVEKQRLTEKKKAVKNDK
jgi:hypothetical protein